MRTPAGKECKYFFGDYFRGRNREECRLISAQPGSTNWNSKLCYTCPVPGILLANACENLVLSANIKRPVFFLKPRMIISAYCTKSQQRVDEPHIGCGQCHPIPDIFNGESNDPDIINRSG